jgi:hypothetical protein
MEESLTRLNWRITEAAGNINTPEGLAYFDSLCNERRKRILPGFDRLLEELNETKRSIKAFSAQRREYAFWMERRRRRNERWERFWNFFGLN